MKLYVIRHGETRDNHAGIIQGQLQGSLTNLGKQQAIQTSETLANIKFDQAWTSDLKRATDTANLIIKPHPYLKLQSSKLLREYDFGDYQGKPVNSWHWPNDKSSLNLKITGGESASQLADRLIKFLNDLLLTSPNETILIVTHNGPVRILRSLIDKVRLGQIIETPVANAKPLTLEVTKPLNASDLTW